MDIDRAVAANAEATDIIIHFRDGGISAAKPDDPRLVGVTVEPWASGIPVGGRMLSKLDLYRRLDDGELAAFAAYMRDQSTLRQRLNFEACLEIDKSDIHWRSILIILLGPDRAASVLA